MHKHALWYCTCVEDQWNRLSPRERAEKEAFIAGEKSVTRGYMKMVRSVLIFDYHVMIVTGTS